MEHSSSPSTTIAHAWRGAEPLGHAERAQRRGVHDDAALVVGRAAPVQPAVADDRLERRALPLVGRALGLHVVVRVQQHASAQPAGPGTSP